MKQFLLTLMIITGLLQGVDAQSLRSNRFEEYTLSLGGGYTGLIDTYLSPLCY